MLYAIIVIALVATITSSVIALITREQRITLLSRNSQVAFYAAESALECALYWIEQDTSGNCGPGGATLTLPPAGSVDMSEITFGNGSCARVEVDRTLATPGDRVVTSRGYNRGCGVTSQFRVERGIRARY